MAIEMWYRGNAWQGDAGGGFGVLLILVRRTVEIGKTRRVRQRARLGQHGILQEATASMSYHGFERSRQTIAGFCRKHHIRRLALFGSVLRDDFRPESDVDMLVEFESGATPGFGFIGIQDELSEILGRRVDLHTPS